MTPTLPILQTKSLQITILAVGSRGDLQPYCALAVGLRRASQLTRKALNYGTSNWWGSDVQYDTGKHSSIAATNDGYIVEVHRSDGEYAKLWYRIGQLDISAKGVKWITQRAIAQL